MSVVPSSLLPASTAPHFRGRIGRDMRSGHYAVPRRYRLHIAPSGPGCLALAVTHGLLALDRTVPLTVLPPIPDTPDGGYTVLRPLYEASAHLYGGPAAAPVLSDHWTGRIVSTHVPDILGDLALRFRGDGPDLLPERHRDEIDAIAERCARDIDRAARRAGRARTGQGGAGDDPLTVLLAALASLEDRLAGRPYVLGDRPTLADAHVWSTLVHLDTVHLGRLTPEGRARVTAHPALWAYARRLTAEPAFSRHLSRTHGWR